MISQIIWYMKGWRRSSGSVCLQPHSWSVSWYLYGFTHWFKSQKVKKMLKMCFKNIVFFFCVFLILFWMTLILKTYVKPERQDGKTLFTKHTRVCVASEIFQHFQWRQIPDQHFLWDTLWTRSWSTRMARLEIQLWKASAGSWFCTCW